MSNRFKTRQVEALEPRICLTASGFDANDQISEAFDVGFVGDPYTLTGSIIKETDVDLFEIQAVAGQKMSFDIDTATNGNPGLGSYLRLFDSSGNQLAANNDAKAPEESRVGFDAYVDHTFSRNGSYFIGVSNWLNASYDPVSGGGDSSGNQWTTGKYRLVIKTLDSPILLRKGVLTFNGDDNSNHGFAEKIGSELKVKLDSAATEIDVTKVEQIRFFGKGKDDVFNNQSSLPSLQVGGEGNDRLYGGTKQDTLKGGNGNDRLFGRAGNDLLWGMAGNDWLNGGAGNDRQSGGAANDTYIFAGKSLGADNILSHAGINSLSFKNFAAKVDLDLQKTDSQVVSSGNLNLKLQSATSIDHVFGSSLGNEILGNRLRNKLFGGNGDDVFAGRRGNDFYNGFKGNDRFVFAGSKLGYDSIVAGDSTGVEKWLDFRGFQNKSSEVGISVDLRQTGSPQTISTGQLRLKITGTITRVSGSPHDDTILGNNADNRIFGNGGDDTLSGRGGDDHLYGGSGNDGLIGFSGNNRLVGGIGRDRFLVKPSEAISDLRDWDARIDFRDGSANWQIEEVESVDKGLKRLHEETGNTKLLKTAAGTSFKLERHKVSSRSTSSTLVLATNQGVGEIEFFDAAFTVSRPVHYTTVHEIAHNWDDNIFAEPTYDRFVALSGWRESSAPGFKTENSIWWYREGTEFARSQGEEGPSEDIATSWEAYFFIPDIWSDIPDKIDAIADFMNSKSN